MLQWRRRAARLVLMLPLMLPAPASAALGGSEASVQTDRVHIQGALLRVMRTDAYALHEMQAPAGTLVREYVSSTGTVFAVAWNGPRIPDLRQILGDYFDQYAAAARARRTARSGHGPLIVREPGLVVEIAGHGRAFSGRAYVPELVPDAVQVESIR